MILVTPAAVGGVALNVRYLRRAKVNATDAAASVGVSQAMSFLIYVVLVLISVGDHRPVACRQRAAAARVGVHRARGRRRHRADRAGRARPGAGRSSRGSGSIAGQVIPRLLDVAQRRGKLVEGIGGALLITIAYILCLAASVRAMGVSHVPIASIAVVYLTGNAVGSIVPIPGGIGAIETAMSLGLTAAGLPGGTAIAAVLLFRTVTFWLPAPAGWAALHYLQRTGTL